MINRVNQANRETELTDELALKRKLTDDILLSWTKEIETSAWFMMNSTALGPVMCKAQLIKLIFDWFISRTKFWHNEPSEKLDILALNEIHPRNEGKPYHTKSVVERYVCHRVGTTGLPNQTKSNQTD